MPFPVKNLIEGQGEPVTVSRDYSVKDALDLMIEHDFDQLPVVGENKRHLGMVTNVSILRSLNYFGVKLDSLRVSDALTKARAFREDDDLFDLLNDLRERFAVTIVDGSHAVVGVVTSYDTTEFFRQQSENLMMVEDIELALRQYILTVVGAREHEENDDLRDAVAKIKPPGRTKKFDDLTLGEYIKLFLHDDLWNLYKSIFTIEQEAMRKLLDEVRKIRNHIMHFSGDLNAHQRSTLRFCSQWLDDHQGAMEKAFTTEEAPSKGTTAAESAETQIEREEDVAPLEESSAGEGKYAPLAIWLQALPAKKDKVELTFQEIEAKIGDDLPPYARAHRSWWANVVGSRSQSRQWLGAGWRTSRIDVAEEKVVFSRITEQKLKYIEFFDALMTELRQTTDLPVREPRPDGRSWHHVASLPDGKPHLSFLAFAFTRDKRFRVELYIDTGDAEKNKAIFDTLHRKKDEIEASLGEGLNWERLDGKRASRVALYRDGSISDEDPDLKRLRDWAVPTAIKFREVLSRYLPNDV